MRCDTDDAALHLNPPEQDFPRLAKVGRLAHTAPMRVAAILVAAGSGSRFGGPVPKQFLALAGRPVVRWAAESLLGSTIAWLQPVGDPAAIGVALAGLDILPAVPGGVTRRDSVRAGLEALAPHAPEFVLVHDAARPFFRRETVPALLEALKTHAGAIPAIPVADTLKRAVAGLIETTVARHNLFRAQTPQAFHFDVLLDLHRACDDPAATDDAWLLEQAGRSVALIPGDEENIKLTFAPDAARLERSLSASLVSFVGTGFDVHACAAGRQMILCGIEVPCEVGLAGHSDADVGIHALCDAIYGALAEGDIGRHFPPSEAAWKDADSARFLRHAASRIFTRGGYLVNADVTLICERPKITPHAPAMRARLAELLGVPIGRISVKATTTERLGFPGRGEGVAAQAAVAIMAPLDAGVQ